MTTNPPSELDEIRAILRTVAEQQARSQQQIDDLRGILQTSIPDLTEMVGLVLTGLDEYTAEMRAIQAADRSDRASERLMEVRARNEFRSDMRGLQNESRNLLRELSDLRRGEQGH